MVQEPLIQFTLRLDGGADASQDELLELATNLRQELTETNVEAVEMVRGTATPASSKGVDAATAQLLVTLGVGIIPSIIVLVQSFLLRQKDQTLKVKIKDVELEVPRNATPDEIERIVKMIEKVAKKVS